MTKTRLEAFSDGVIAIIITIMVLELKTPHETTWEAIKPLIPIFVSYVLSFIMIGIYWGNHHHLLHTITHVDSKIIWANLHLLFWLSLIPFTTGWMGENNFESITVAAYGGIQCFCAIAYFILLHIITKGHAHQEKLNRPLEKQYKKGTISLALYMLSVITAFIHPAIAGSLFILVGILWLIPDRNIEKTLKED